MRIQHGGGTVGEDLRLLGHLPAKLARLRGSAIRGAGSQAAIPDAGGGKAGISGPAHWRGGRAAC
jgi:hypothetical protein